ncbi:hypothetical protein KVR01_009697 [Diaporthe batatas]|uniref:uncharacterized protein n=1 Tax=Diaporthe batatas TaxID=748121 RepID=UPI001D03C69F|nr:uncharacterized protein KVR01_009697 [Diaporthe batatas]KAG8160161.1 hypothetical protein KVR01_009697 [Diaporthe batatas]
METQNPCYGTLVALEGSPDAVKTQLNLLPASPQLLVLPSLQSYMGNPGDGTFHARSLIKQVHNAANKRQEDAVRFLQHATPTNKRLVFLNGGTASAVSYCITAISENQTSGDIHEAELMFRNIALEGLRGLDREDKHSDEATLCMLGREKISGESILGIEEPEDPITRAMRAADMLYKETDSLQPIDCYIRTRPRSLSLPMYGYSDGTGEPSPFFVFGPAPHDDTQSHSEDDNNNLVDCRGMAEDEFAKLCAIKFQTDASGEDLPALDHSADCTGESYCVAEARSSTRRSDALLSPPATPDGVVYGEARVVQMRASKMQVTLRESRSLDDLELEATRSRRAELEMTSIAGRVAPPVDNPDARSRHLSINDKPYPTSTLLHLPQARFVKANTTTIRKSPTFVRRVPKPARDCYVDRGTDAAADMQEDLDEPFQPLLPILEDLSIHMTSQATDAVLGMVIEYFKAGAFPVAPFPASLQTLPTDSCPSTPRTADLFDLEQDADAGLSPVIEHPGAEEAGEYDPFAARGRDVRASCLALQPPSPPPPASVPPDSRQPPISAPISPMIQRDMESRFHDFSTTGSLNAVATQNALRSVLEVYFPPPDSSCPHQIDFPMLQDIGSLWRPIFGKKATSDCGDDNSENTPDLILAMGRQNGVKRELLSTLTGQVERLGTKSSGMSRSGRLDLRYLVANAMQSLAVQAVAHHTQTKPSNDPYFLAGLVVPQLEAYLAANYGTRFLLLEYPAEHLATVLALQRLIGSELFKVAGIIDSEATSPSPIGVSSPISSRNNSYSTVPLSNTDACGLDSFNLPGSPFPGKGPDTQPENPKYSFSEANYLLTSSATASEISAFTATILKDLTDIDNFYTPDASNPPPGRPGTAAAGTALPALMSKFTLQGPNGSPAYTHTAVLGPAVNLPVSPPYTNDGDAGSGRSTPRVVAASGLAAHNFPFPPPPAPRSPSPAPSVASSRSRGPGGPHGARARSQTRRRLGRMGNEGGPDDAASMYAVSVVEDGEFYDEEEKRLMPLYLRQSEMRKGNSRKALKWLGLA